MRSYMREYMKKWRKKNPEKAKEIQDRYWEKRAEQMGEDNEPRQPIEEAQ